MPINKMFVLAFIRFLNPFTPLEYGFIPLYYLMELTRIPQPAEKKLLRLFRNPQVIFQLSYTYGEVIFLFNTLSVLPLKY